MKTSMLVLLLVGISATFAMPTTARPKYSMKDAVRMLLETSELQQNRGNRVTDATEKGLDRKTLLELKSSGESAEERFYEVVRQVSDILEADGGDPMPEDFDQELADGAVEILKEETKILTSDFTEDEKLAMITGDKMAINTLQLTYNVDLFSKTLKVIEESVSELEALLEDDMSDDDIKAILPELVGELGAEVTALSLGYKAIEKNFEDGSDLVKEMEEVPTDADEKEKESGEQESDKQEAQETEVTTAAPSRQRRSPFNNNRFGGRSGFGGRSSFGSSGFRGTSSRGTPPRSSSRGGWSVGLGGVTWRNRRGNIRVNAGPTFGKGGIGASASIRIEF